MTKREWWDILPETEKQEIKELSGKLYEDSNETFNLEFVRAKLIGD